MAFENMRDILITTAIVALAILSVIGMVSDNNTVRVVTTILMAVTLITGIIIFIYHITKDLKNETRNKHN